MDSIIFKSSLIFFYDTQRLMQPSARACWLLSSTEAKGYLEQLMLILLILLAGGCMMLGDSLRS